MCSFGSSLTIKFIWSFRLEHFDKAGLFVNNPVVPHFWKHGYCLFKDNCVLSAYMSHFCIFLETFARVSFLCFSDIISQILKSWFSLWATIIFSFCAANIHDAGDSPGWKGLDWNFLCEQMQVLCNCPACCSGFSAQSVEFLIHSIICIQVGTWCSTHFVFLSCFFGSFFCAHFPPVQIVHSKVPRERE